MKRPRYQDNVDGFFDNVQLEAQMHHCKKTLFELTGLTPHPKSKTVYTLRDQRHYASGQHGFHAAVNSSFEFQPLSKTIRTDITQIILRPPKAHRT